jgi:hypothetical protein
MNMGFQPTPGWKMGTGIIVKAKDKRGNMQRKVVLRGLKYIYIVVGIPAYDIPIIA